MGSRCRPAREEVRGKPSPPGPGQGHERQEERQTDSTAEAMHGGSSGGMGPQGSTSDEHVPSIAARTVASQTPGIPPALAHPAASLPPDRNEPAWRGSDFARDPSDATVAVTLWLSSNPLPPAGVLPRLRSERECLLPP